jgi:Flp pilus assembly protein TadD
MMQAMKWNLASKLLASILLVTAPWMVSVAADSPPTKSDPAWLTDTRASIKSNNYEQALKQLQAANEVNSADWNNLMGYSLRKKQAPDLASSEKYYQAALKIDPSHRSALEYYGELLLMKKDLPGAEAMLARLDKACRFGCEEYSDLKESIAKYQGKK